MVKLDSTLVDGHKTEEVENALLEKYILQFIKKECEAAVKTATLSLVKKEASEKTQFLEANLSLFGVSYRQIYSMLNTASVLLILWFLMVIWTRDVFPTRQTASLPTQRAAMPAPFFSPRLTGVGGVLTDLYDGDGAERDELTTRAEIVVVMFYAPWSLHCMQARDLFVQIASAFSTFNSTIKFVAVNCHDYRGKCRALYKLYSYPLIFAYVSNGPPILFHRSLTIDALFTWISHLMRPYTKIQSEEEFSKILANFDYLIVAYMNPYDFTGNISRPFNVFFASALKSWSLTYSVGFATIQSHKLAVKFGLDARNEIKIYNSYASKEINKTNNNAVSTLPILPSTNSNDVILWLTEAVEKTLSKIVDRINFEDYDSGGKSLFRKINATEGVLVLFTNIIGNNYLSTSHVQMKMVAKSFYDCSFIEAEESNSSWASMKNGRNLKFDFPHIGEYSIEKFLDFAVRSCQVASPQNTELEDCCAAIIENEKFDSKYSFKKNGEELPEVCSNVFRLSNSNLFRRRCRSLHRDSLKRNYLKKDRKLFRANLPFASKIACNLLRLLRITQPQFLVQNRQQHKLKNFETLPSGFRTTFCQSNRTVGFLVVERRFANFFVKRWQAWSNYDLRASKHQKGINGTVKDHKKNSDVVALISNPDEQFFWLDKEISSFSMAKMVAEFVAGNLSSNRPVLFQNSTWDLNVESQTHLPTISVDDNVSYDRYDNAKEEEHIINNNDGDDRISVLQQINVSQFLVDIIGKKNEFDSFVFFSGGRWHGPSQLIPHLLHVVSDYFRPFNSLIQFYILDTSKNQLPWQYTFENLPAFVFFPARRPMESITFPSWKFPFSVPNLMAFLLAHCQSAVRWQLALTACGPSCLARNTRRLRVFVRRLDDDIRDLRRTVRHVHALNNHLRVLLKKRFVQRRAVRHFQDAVGALLDEKILTQRQKKQHGGIARKTVKRFSKNLLLLNWILKQQSHTLLYPI